MLQWKQLEFVFSFAERGKRQREISRCLACPTRPFYGPVWVVEEYDQVKFCAAQCAERSLKLVGLITASEHFSHVPGEGQQERYFSTKRPSTKGKKTE